MSLIDSHDFHFFSSVCFFLHFGKVLLALILASGFRKDIHLCPFN